MNVNLYNTTDYENKWQRTLGENKPNSNPIQSQTKPIKANKMPKQTQFKPKTNPIQTQYKPNQTQFQRQKNAAEFVQGIFARENRQRRALT